MAEFKNELDPIELAAHWTDYIPQDGNIYELAFDYHGKERLGRIDKITPEHVTLCLTTDGDEHFKPSDEHFKSFRFDKIESEIEVYKLS